MRARQLGHAILGDHPWRTTDQSIAPNVHQHNPGIDDDGVRLHVSDGDFNHTVDDFAHVVIVAFSRRGWVVAGVRRLQTGDPALSSCRISGATSVPKSSIERMVFA